LAERFYTPDPLGPGEYVLTGPESHHLATVRRFATGDRVVLFNGDGHDYISEVVSVSRKSAVLNVLSTIAVNRELPIELVVASALPKGDRGDFLIEKLTELGVTRFVPLITTRSVVVPKENARERLERAVIEAGKQCGRNQLMGIDPPQKWEALLSRNDLPRARIVLHTGPGLHAMTNHTSVVIAIGPEGGFTDEEIAKATAAGWGAASLGPRMLRVETAAVAAAAILSSPVASAPPARP
jgi:16S rRNA (uracil1498-N3)-methyltransferase